MTPGDEYSWHLDRRIPIALILTMVGQFALVIWWVATTDARLTRVEQTLGGMQSVPLVMERLVTRLDTAETSIASTITRTSESDKMIQQNARQVAVLVEQVRFTTDAMNRVFSEIAETNKHLRMLLEDGR